MLDLEHDALRRGSGPWFTQVVNRGEWRGGFAVSHPIRRVKPVEKGRAAKFVGRVVVMVKRGAMLVALAEVSV